MPDRGGKADVEAIVGNREATGDEGYMGLS